MMGTSGITNLVNDLNLLNVDIPKNSDSSTGEFAKTFENVSQNGDIDIKPKDINVVDELKTSDSVKDNYLKETNGKKFENKVEAQGDKAVSKTNSVSSDSKTKLNNADTVEEVTDEAVENVINAY